MSATAEEGCGSLWEALSRVCDHRRRVGQRYPLAGLLLIAVAALLAGRRDQLGIVRWGRQLSAQAPASLGITRGRVPAPSVWCELFQGLDVTSLEAALGDWVRGGRSPGTSPSTASACAAMPPRRGQACTCWPPSATP